MQDQQKSRRFPVGIVTGVSVFVLATAGGVGAAWWALNTLTSSSTTPSAPTTSQVQPSPLVKAPSKEERVQIYWFNASGNEIKLLAHGVTIEKSAQPREVLESAFKRLLAGPSDQAYTTNIPGGTKLLSVNIKNDGVHVNLSQEFTKGGGTSSMTGRLAQILYTATSINPKTGVWIDIEGKPLEVLGGEGIIVDQPMTRKDFEQNYQL
ncbi:MAG: spore germination protein [Moorea sp. SIO2B7]|nr:spore germination protein [Moorena sp. SIO2B7]